MKKTLLYIGIGVLVLAGLLFALSFRAIPKDISYGVSFSKLHADELRLDWKQTYDALLNDLQIKHLRLSATWPMIQPAHDSFHFDELDYQMKEAQTHGADVILAVGLRTPGWPECHTPDWLRNDSREHLQEHQLRYVEEVVKRYRDAPNLRYWQVENEVFLHFATQYCDAVDEAFLEREIALVRSLDPKHPILMTDSGEFGKWYKAYSHGDVFATSVYLYVWHHIFGPVHYPIGPGFFRFKQNMVEWFLGKKPMILSELGAEPWLSKPIVDASIEEQMERMDIDTFEHIIDFGRRTGFSEQYLWGVEWWQYMKQKGHGEFWERAKELYK